MTETPISGDPRPRSLPFLGDEQRIVTAKDFKRDKPQEVDRAKRIIEQAKAVVEKEEGEGDVGYDLRVMGEVEQRLKYVGDWEGKRGEDDPVARIIQERIAQGDLPERSSTLMAVEVARVDLMEEENKRMREEQQASLKDMGNEKKGFPRRQVYTEVSHQINVGNIGGPLEKIWDETREWNVEPRRDILAFTIVADRLLDAVDPTTGGDKTYRQTMKEQQDILRNSSSTKAEKDNASKLLVELRQEFYERGINVIQNLRNPSYFNPTAQTAAKRSDNQMRDFVQQAMRTPMEELISQYTGVTTTRSRAEYKGRARYEEELKLSSKHQQEMRALLTGLDEESFRDKALKGADFFKRRTSFNPPFYDIPPIHTKKQIEGPEGRVPGGPLERVDVAKTAPTTAAPAARTPSEVIDRAARDVVERTTGQTGEPRQGLDLVGRQHVRELPPGAPETTGTGRLPVTPETDLERALRELQEAGTPPVSGPTVERTAAEAAGATAPRVTAPIVEPATGGEPAGEVDTGGVPPITPAPAPGVTRQPLSETVEAVAATTIERQRNLLKQQIEEIRGWFPLTLLPDASRTIKQRDLALLLYRARVVPNDPQLADLREVAPADYDKIYGLLVNAIKERANTPPSQYESRGGRRIPLIGTIGAKKIPVADADQPWLKAWKEYFEYGSPTTAPPSKRPFAGIGEGVAQARKTAGEGWKNWKKLRADLSKQHFPRFVWKRKPTVAEPLTKPAEAPPWSTGRYLSDWEDVADYLGRGYTVEEVSGRYRLTREQILDYQNALESGDPSVTVNSRWIFGEGQLSEDGKNELMRILDERYPGQPVSQLGEEEKRKVVEAIFPDLVRNFPRQAPAETAEASTAPAAGEEPAGPADQPTPQGEVTGPINPVPPRRRPPRRQQP